MKIKIKKSALIERVKNAKKPYSLPVNKNDNEAAMEVLFQEIYEPLVSAIMQVKQENPGITDKEILLIASRVANQAIFESV